MSEVLFTVRTADQTRKAKITVPRDQSATDVLQAAVENWALPTGTDYTIVNVTKGRVLVPGEKLTEAALSDDDIVEIQPVLVAG